MIRVHRLNGSETVVNAELIESIEVYGRDTVLAFATGNKIVVQESVTEVIQKVVEYKQSVYIGASYLPQFLKGSQERSPSCH